MPGTVTWASESRAGAAQEFVQGQGHRQVNSSYDNHKGGPWQKWPPALQIWFRYQLRSSRAIVTMLLPLPVKYSWAQFLNLNFYDVHFTLWIEINSTSMGSCWVTCVRNFVLHSDSQWSHFYQYLSFIIFYFIFVLVYCWDHDGLNSKAHTKFQPNWIRTVIWTLPPIIISCWNLSHFFQVIWTTIDNYWTFLTWQDSHTGSKISLLVLSTQDFLARI